MALRLSKALGRFPESWLIMQGNYDLWHARQTANLDAVEKIEYPSACVQLPVGAIRDKAAIAPYKDVDFRLGYFCPSPRKGKISNS